MTSPLRPALKIDVLARGGHCAFLEDYGLRSWLDRAVLAEIERVVAQLTLAASLETSSGDSPLVTLISPSMIAPSATAIEFPERLPETRAVPEISTRCFAMTSPSTVPATTMSIAFNVPFQCPPSASVNGPLMSQSPSTVPQKTKAP